MKKWIITLLAIGLTNLASAALPPLAQSCRELRTIIDDQRIYDLLGGSEPLEQILKEGHSYFFVTPTRILQVDLHFIQQNKAGPANFELEFHQPIER